MTGAKIGRTPAQTQELRRAERTNGNAPRWRGRGGHRKGDEPFLMLTQTMAQDPAVIALKGNAARGLLMFYRAHIQASAQGKASFEMDRRWLMKLLKVSKSSADRAIAQLVVAKLIIKHGRRALSGPCRYRLALPNDTDIGPPAPPEEHVEHNPEYAVAKSNSVTGDAINSVMADADNSVRTDTTRARMSLPVVDEGCTVGSEALSLSPSSVEQTGDGGLQWPSHITTSLLGSYTTGHVDFSEAWEACRLECRNGCTEPGGCPKLGLRPAPAPEPPVPPPPPPPDEMVVSNAGLHHLADDNQAAGVEDVGDVVSFAKPAPKPAPVLPAMPTTQRHADEMLAAYRAEAPKAPDLKTLGDLFMALVAPCIRAGFLDRNSRHQYDDVDVARRTALVNAGRGRR